MNKITKRGTIVRKNISESRVTATPDNVSIDHVLEALKALKGKRTAQTDYQYDLYVSYVHGSIFQDWLYRALEALESWLTIQLGRRPLVFHDSYVERDQAWLQECLHALQTSRYMVPILSPQYFKSHIATAEWQSFIEREQDAGEELVFPICILESSDYPKEARQKKWLDLTQYFSVLPGYWNTAGAIELEEKLREFARDLAARIKPTLLLPDYRAVVYVTPAVPEPFEKQSPLRWK